MREPKFYVKTSSTNLSPDEPVAYAARMSTHHWDGVILDDEQKYALIEITYKYAHQTDAAVTYMYRYLTALMKAQPFKAHTMLTLPENTVVELSDENTKYYDLVGQATSLGWAWEETYAQNLKEHRGASTIALYTWVWNGLQFGSTFRLSKLLVQKKDRRKTLKHLLERIEKTKKLFPDSIPSMTINGDIIEDTFLTALSSPWKN